MEQNDNKRSFPAEIFARFVVIWTLATRVPLPESWWPYPVPEGSRALPLIPLVGGIMGFATGTLITVVNILGLGQIPSVWIGAAFYTMAGWSLHLDGWGDLWDGLGSGRRGDALREVMKDSRVGSFGIISLILAFGLWTSLLLSVGYHYETTVLMVSGALGRFSLCVASRFGCYPWEGSMGKDWVDGFGNRELAAAFVCTLIFFPAAPFECSLSLLLGSLLAFIAARCMNSRLGGVNGDVLGAVAVACELISLGVFAF